jgi:hypothetical protein
MNLAPANPNFIQARDAILLADRMLNLDANFVELWDAFAKRGLGAAASSPPSTNTIGLHEDFTRPVHPTIYVNWAYPFGDSDGSAAHPYRTVGQANQVAQPFDFIVIQAGSYSETLTLSTCMTVRSQGGIATIGP